MKKKVIVAMSGGVDSSAAAALLKEDGYDVSGVTMCLGLPQESESNEYACCGPQAISDARAVATAIGMSHYVLSFGRELQEMVIDTFRAEYLRGRTPNPCILCNQHLKFDALLRKSAALGADFLATGHYARITGGNEPRLTRAADPRKDQTYFLYTLKEDQMRRILFPLGGFEKSEIRAIAQSRGLPVAHKPESMDLCFIANGDYRALLNIPDRPGPIVDTSGNQIGEHTGTWRYTVGQRRGLGIAAENPLYVVSIDADSNTITAGSRHEAFTRTFTVTNTSFPGETPEHPFQAAVRIRNMHREAPACISPAETGFTITFDEPQFAVTPGQSAVFYDGDIVIGGGVIDRTEPL